MTTTSIAERSRVGQCARPRVTPDAAEPRSPTRSPRGHRARASSRPSPPPRLPPLRGPLALRAADAHADLRDLRVRRARRAAVRRPVSDDVGRRPVLLVSLAALALSSVRLHRSLRRRPGSSLRRGIQGLATGAAISAASAALLDLHPRRDAAASASPTASRARRASRSVSSSRRRSSSSATRRARFPTSCSSRSS